MRGRGRREGDNTTCHHSTNKHIPVNATDSMLLLLLLFLCFFGAFEMMNRIKQQQQHNYYAYIKKKQTALSNHRRIPPTPYLTYIVDNPDPPLWLLPGSKITPTNRKLYTSQTYILNGRPLHNID